MHQNVILSAVSQNEYGYLMIYAKMDVGGGSVWEFDDLTRQKKKKARKTKAALTLLFLLYIHYDSKEIDRSDNLTCVRSWFKSP